MRVMEKVGEGALVPATDGLLKDLIGASCTGWRTPDDGINISVRFPRLKARQRTTKKGTHKISTHKLR